MQRPTFADPKTDFAFKRIFGSEEHKDVLVAFLNDMLDLDSAHRAVTVELLPPSPRPAVAELKLSIVDVIAIQSERGALAVAEKRGEARGTKRGCDWGSKLFAVCLASRSRQNGGANWTVSMRRSLNGCWPISRTRRCGREQTPVRRSACSGRHARVRGSQHVTRMIRA